MYSHFCAMSSVLYFQDNRVKEESGNRFDLKNINYNKVNNISFFQYQMFLLALFIQGVSVHGG